jgi:hypothetical protein
VIRRESISASGILTWILVPQIEHAYLAADVADAWRFGALPAAMHDDLRQAVRHHDDGWRIWDERITLDSESAAPAPFDGMQFSDSLAIWTESINLAGGRDPLVGYLVSGHFSRLLERFSRWRNDSALEPMGEQFLADQRHKRAGWFDHWRAGDPQHRLPEIAELGVSFLQMFDAISLWLCCADRSEPWSVSVPGGSWKFLPRGDNRWTIEPWSLEQTELTLKIQGREVPRGNYQSGDELRAAGIACNLNWQLEK